MPIPILLSVLRPLFREGLLLGFSGWRAPHYAQLSSSLPSTQPFSIYAHSATSHLFCHTHPFLTSTYFCLGNGKDCRCGHPAAKGLLSFSPHSVEMSYFKAGVTACHSFTQTQLWLSSATEHMAHPLSDLSPCCSLYVHKAASSPTSEFLHMLLVLPTKYMG